jgi:hypothetical protein
VIGWQWCDGEEGCLVHVQRNVRTYLPSRPRTDAGRARLRLGVGKGSDEDQHTGAGRGMAGPPQRLVPGPRASRPGLDLSQRHRRRAGTGQNQPDLVVHP